MSDAADGESRGGAAPPVDEKPYRIEFDAQGCIGSGPCAAASDNWRLSLDTGISSPKRRYLAESEFDANTEAAERCPAKKGKGVIRLVDRRTGEVVAPADAVE